MRCKTREGSTLRGDSSIGKNTEEAIDQSVTGWRDVNLARRLRNKFAHAPGRYDKTDAKARKLFEELSTHYPHEGTWDGDADSVYPIPIDEVLEPMKNASKEYAAGFCAKALLAETA